jgi:hypothetical protein
MTTGYFAGLLAFLYRETTDGRRVTSRRIAPFLPPRWLLVPPVAQARFERRTKQAHIVSMVALVLGVRFVGDAGALRDILVLATVLALVVVPLLQAWATAGLPAYDQDASTLVPIRRFEMQERQARAMGPRMLAGFVVLSVLLVIPQAIVAVQDGVWWAWLGLLMFAGLGLFFARMLARLRAEQRAARTT